MRYNQYSTKSQGIFFFFFEIVFSSIYIYIYIYIYKKLPFAIADQLAHLVLKRFLRTIGHGINLPNIDFEKVDQIKDFAKSIAFFFRKIIFYPHEVFTHFYFYLKSLKCDILPPSNFQIMTIQPLWPFFFPKYPYHIYYFILKKIQKNKNKNQKK